MAEVAEAKIQPSSTSQMQFYADPHTFPGNGHDPTSREKSNRAPQEPHAED